MHILKTVQNGKNWCTRPLKPKNVDAILFLNCNYKYLCL